MNLKKNRAIPASKIIWEALFHANNRGPCLTKSWNWSKSIAISSINHKYVIFYPLSTQLRLISTCNQFKEITTLYKKWSQASTNFCFLYILHHKFIGLAYPQNGHYKYSPTGVCIFRRKQTSDIFQTVVTAIWQRSIEVIWWVNSHSLKVTLISWAPSVTKSRRVNFLF